MSTEDLKKLEELIADKTPDVKARALLLYGAVITTMNGYNKERSASNLRNMEAAKEAYDKFIDEIGGGKTGEAFDNLASVLQHLENGGYKVTKTSLYRHHREGKILPQSDGTYHEKDVDRYARTFLKQKATGKRIQEKTDQLQREKLEQELKNLKLKNDREQLSYDKEKGLYIPRDEEEIELAARAGILQAGLKHWIQSNAADWISSVGGDTRKVGELINSMTNNLDEHINHYAGNREYEVVIDEEPVPAELITNVEAQEI